MKSRIYSETVLLVFLNVLIKIAVASIDFSGSELHGSSNESCDTLYLLNVVPYPDKGPCAGWDRGFELIPAGHLATKHINNILGILDGYKLELIDVSSEACGRDIITEGLKEVYELMVNPRSSCIFGIVSLYCSSVTDVVAPFIGHPKIGYVQLAASNSLPHRNTSEFPYLFHVIASSKILNTAVLTMMDKFEWMEINMVYDSNGILFINTASDFSEIINQNNKTLVSSYPLLNGFSECSKSTGTRFDITEVFGNAEQVRITYLIVTSDASAVILCEAFKMDYVWPGFMYIINEQSVDEILSKEVDCSREDMLKALNHAFLLKYQLITSNETMLRFGLTYEEYHQQYMEELSKLSNRSGMKLEANVYANVLYDQVWAFALAANESLQKINLFNSSINPDNIQEMTKNREILTAALKKVSFEGVSGFINFGDKQEVQTIVDIYQVINDTEILVGRYDHDMNNIEFTKDFNIDDIPPDTFDTIYRRIPKWMEILFYTCDSVLIILIAFSTFSIIYLRKHPEIKSTSLLLSFIIIVGCIFLCVSPLLHTVQNYAVNNPTTFSVLCNLEYWLFINGLNIIFVTLLVRLLRIYHVFRTFQVTGKYWSDKYLVLYITLISSVMVVVFFVIWASVGFAHQVKVQKYVSLPQPHYDCHAYCSSSSMETWFSICLCLVGLVFVAVIFLAIQTRHIKRKHFKDTKKVNVFVFSVCITLSILLPLVYFFPLNHVITYVCKCISSVGVAALCQFFLFLPKTIPTLLQKLMPQPPRQSVTVGGLISNIHTTNQSFQTQRHFRTQFSSSSIFVKKDSFFY